MRGSVSAGFFISAADAMTKTDIANLALSKIGETLIDDIDDTGDRRARLAKLHYEPTLREILRAHFWGFAMTCPALDSHPTQSIFITGTLAVGADAVVCPELIPAIAGEWSSDGNENAPASGTWYRLIHSSPTWTLSIFEDGVETAFWESVTDPATPEALEFAPTIGVSGTATANFGLSKTIMPWAVAWTYPDDVLKLRRLLDAEGNRVEHFEFRRLNGARRILTRDLSEVHAEYVQFVDDPPDYDPLFTAAFVTLLASRLARAISGSDKLEGDLRSLYETVDLPAARTADGYDSQSNENRPLREFLDGSLTGGRGEFFPEFES